MSKIRNLFIIFSKTLIIQITIQLLGILGGILIIRLLPVKEYGYYTIANSMLGAMNILSNGGVISGTLGEGAKVYEDHKKLGKVIATGLYLRKYLSIISLSISSIVLIYLLLKNEADWVTAIIITLSIIPSFYAILSATILEIPMKLHQNVFKLQQNQLIAAVGRIIFISSLLFAPFVSLAILADGISRFIANLRLKKLSIVYYDDTEIKSESVQKRLLKIIKNVLPIDAYNIFSSQISIWILSFFGTVLSIGQLGALYRIGAITNIFSMAFTILIIPQYLRLKLNKKQDFTYLLLLNFLLILISLLMLTIVGFFSNFFLKLLGFQYKGLDHELFLVMVMFCFNFSSNIIYNINISKGIMINPIIFIFINLMAIITGGMMFDFSKLSSVIIYSIYISSISYLVYFIYLFYISLKK